MDDSLADLIVVPVVPIDTCGNAIVRWIAAVLKPLVAQAECVCLAGLQRYAVDHVGCTLASEAVDVTIQAGRYRSTRESKLIWVVAGAVLTEQLIVSESCEYIPRSDTQLNKSAGIKRQGRCRLCCACNGQCIARPCSDIHNFGEPIRGHQRGEERIPCC